MRLLLFLTIILGWPTISFSQTSGETESVFGAFTAHIARQIALDKRSFVDAQGCTAWFYRQRDRKPAKPPAEGVRYRRQAADALDRTCPQRYPGGIDAAREAFGRTQSNLSLSLTFYEFALVGDRDDDERYSARELQDVLESFGLPFDQGLPITAHLAALTRHFDRLHHAGSLETLMTGMGTLYEKGYRFTRRDRAALDRISG